MKPCISGRIIHVLAALCMVGLRLLEFFCGFLWVFLGFMCLPNCYAYWMWMVQTNSGMPVSKDGFFNNNHINRGIDDSPPTPHPNDIKQLAPYSAHFLHSSESISRLGRRKQYLRKAMAVNSRAQRSTATLLSQTVQLSRFRRDYPDFAWKSRFATNMRSE